jgi:hypothetical protein
MFVAAASYRKIKDTAAPTKMNHNINNNNALKDE